VANAFKYGRSSFLATIFVVLASALTAIPTDLPAKEPYVDLDHDEEEVYNTHELMEINEVIQPGHLAIIGLELGVTKVDEIEGRLGKSEDPLSFGDHHSLRQICYVSDRQADTSKLILGVDPDDSVLVSIRLLSSAYKLKGSSKCISSALVSKEIATISGLKLGMGKEQVKSLIGRFPPSKEKGNRLVYSYVFPRRLTDTEIEELYRGADKHGFKGDKPKCVVLYEFSFIDARFLTSRLTSLEVDVGDESATCKESP
jgi:hypothetical protein